MPEAIEFTKEEKDLKNRIMGIYNSGQDYEAFNEAANFHKSNPNSIMGLYLYGVISGDYAQNNHSLSNREKDELTAIAKSSLQKIYSLESLENYPENFKNAVKNEYYYFFKLYKQQYQLGLSKNETNKNDGLYSMCVGSSMLAVNALMNNKNLKKAERWAIESINAFLKFEKLHPGWYNINHFSSQSYAILGDLPKSEKAFLDMYQKQKKCVTAKQYEEFYLNYQEINKVRKALL